MTPDSGWSVQVGDDGRGLYGWILSTPAPHSATAASGYAATRAEACRAAEAAVLQALDISAHRP